ncbi:MAG: hypothetical protein ACD_63C00244G0002 [uncultured bacterium]|nr:MAG: hypothetical protein ACD_63C00244G0002 [uncultured bacterium]
MAISRSKKEKVVKELVDGFDNAKSVVFIDYETMPVGDFETLRKELRKEKAKMMVVKQTLVSLALGKSKRKNIKLDKFSVPMALVFSGEDEIAPARILYNFAREHRRPAFLKGILENDLLEKDKVKELAVLPSREELLGKFVYVLQSPVRGFASVLAGNLRGLVNVLSAIKDAK